MLRVVTSRTVLAIAVVLTSAAGVHAQAAGTEAAVRALEAKRTAAMVKADVATLKMLLGDDLTYAHSSGVTDTKASMLGLLTSGDLKYKTINETDVKVRFYGDVALLTGRALIVAKRVNAAESSHDLYFTGVWAKAAGEWRFVAWHSTTVAAPAAK